MIRYKLGELLEKRQFQAGKRITIQEIALATGINRTTLSKLLNHKGYVTGTDILDKLCRYFECDLGSLVEYIEDTSQD
jgi:putative transcriptional regulator